MLSVISSHAPLGIDGMMIQVEVDIRRGIPGIDIVGLPDNAVREAKERVRIAIRNSGLRFPADRILVNLAPAGIRKEGASFDLPIALGVLAASGQIPPHRIRSIMVLGELNLAGLVRPVTGVLSAVACGLENKIKIFLVPGENLLEAKALKSGRVLGISSLTQAAKVIKELAVGKDPESCESNQVEMYDYNHEIDCGDFSEIRGHEMLKRALEIAAAGRHHMLLFGPPGSGKTMAARRLPSILPPLNRKESLTVTRIYSIAGILPPGTGLIQNVPFRMPHHTASSEGIIGGGKIPNPGEVSLAHEGILFLDEAAEFKATLLQSLREPMEEGSVTIARANKSTQFPASFQLVFAANPCPCGNLGKSSAVCVCSSTEIYRYWRKIGGALLDRIDIRIPLKPVSAVEMSSDGSEPSSAIRERVAKAITVQRTRYRDLAFNRNSRLKAGIISRFCALNHESVCKLNEAVEQLSLSSRAYHSILKVARTIADLEDSESIQKYHILEAIQYRRYGDGDFFWNCN